MLDVDVEIFRMHFLHTIMLFPELSDKPIELTLEKNPDDAVFNPENKPPYAQLQIKKNKKNLIYDILTFTNSFDFMGETFIRENNSSVVEFMESIGVPFTNGSFTLFCFIHELGHVDLTRKFMDEYGGTLKKLQQYDSTVSSLLDLIFNDDKSSRYTKIYNDLNHNELYAERFAYMHFPRVWKSLRVEI